VVEFTSDGGGQMKDNYRIILEYHDLLKNLIDEWNDKCRAAS
jgi:hypothetical protein